MSRNYCATLLKQTSGIDGDMRWKPGDPSDDLMILRLDTGTSEIIGSKLVESRTKSKLNESWNILGDIYLDGFENRGFVNIIFLLA